MPRRSPRAQSHEGAEPFFGIGNHQFRGRGRRGRAHIGGEVGNCEIDLMANAGDSPGAVKPQWRAPSVRRERPQVFQGTATARQDQHIAFGAAAGSLKCRDDVRCACAPWTGTG